MTAADLPPHERDRLRAVFDRLVPADDWPAVSDAGLFPYLDGLAAEPANEADLAAVVAAVAALDAEARTAHGAGVADLAGHQVDALLHATDPEHRRVLVDAAARAYYGDGLGAGARMVGYRRHPGRGPGAPVVEAVLRATALGEVAGDYDVVVLGAGAGGGVAACVLAEGGARVLVVDRGLALEVGSPALDHLRNHRSSAHGYGTGQRRDPRVLVGEDGPELLERPWDPRFHSGAVTVGGGTRVFQGMAWRFLPDDLRMASRYGVPDGSTLADWPLAYDDLAPHYDWVEWEVGVCGDASGHAVAGPRRRGYPMPPFPPDSEGRRLAGGAEVLGLATGPVPLLINSVPRSGRARCVRCGECVGFPCPTDAKNGSHNTVLPRALAAGATLVTGCRATEVTTSAGRVDGVRLVEDATGAVRTVRAGHVVVACGAIETARLLLASRTDADPDGLGNRTDQVGRHLQGHAFASVFGAFDDPVQDPEGPGTSIATLDWCHGNAADGGPLVGGGVVSDEVVKLPIVHWAWALPPDAPRWGLAGKAAMRETYARTGHLFGQVQEVPRAENRVTLDPDVRDRHGVPVARLAGAAHPETLRTARFLVERSAEWLEASGARRTWADEVPTGLTAGYHQAGTCRMGADAATSVVDPDGRVHGHDNLWIADASVHVTNGSVGPVLTVMALAHRTAHRLLRTR